MAVALDKFVQHLEDSGILAEETLKDFLPPKGDPKDAEELARELVRRKKLTKFQAEEAYKGKGKSLVLGNYVLMEKIGAGGMGQVFKARHRRMDRLVAVKLLPATMTKDKDAIARFEREVKAAAKISHPNIVAAFDADQANGAHYLVMELVEGSDLSALVKKTGPLPQDKAINYILQAAKGLEAAHAAGIVHRDIKPANLLLDKSGTVKILDMGLARLSNEGDAPKQAELTSTGTVMGTVDYMSPEQALNTKSADARSDIYALGCSLYYLLAGKATYDGDSLMAKLIAHREFPIPSLRAACPDVPEQLEVIFSKMIAKKLEDRYQTTTEVIADLEQCALRGGQSGTLHLSGTFQAPAASSTEMGLANSVSEFAIVTNKSAPVTPVSAMPVPAKTTAKPQPGKDQKKMFLIGGVGLGLLVILIALAGIVIRLQTKDGTLVVTVNEPGAKVEVLDEEGKVEITRKGVKEKISISVDPGKHRLKVSKEGFEFFTKDFEIASGGKQPITAKLVPANPKPAVVGSSPPLPSATTPASLRATAVQVLERGGVLTVFAADGKHLTVTKIDQLPSNTSAVDRITFAGDKVDTLGDGVLEGLNFQPGTHLTVSSKNLTNFGLAKLSTSPRSLDLTTPKVTSDGLAHLAKLKGLEGFYLGNMLVSGAELAGLSDSVTNARIHCPITPEALAALGTNRRLKGLGIFAPLTPQHLEALRSSQLETLDLNDPGVNDEAIGRLVGNESLRRLVLQNTKVTAKGLEELKKLKNFEDLEIGGLSPLTADDLKAFALAMPQVQIKSQVGNFARTVARPPAGPNSPVAGLPSLGGSALEFSGQGSRVEIPTLSRDDAGPLTIEAYVTLAATSGNIVVRMEGKADCQLYGWPSTSNPATEWIPNAADARGKFQQGTPAMVLNRRYHLALEFDKDSARVYIDGKLANSQERVPAEAAGTGRGTTIGALADGSAAILATLDEIRISKVRRYKHDFQPQGPFEPDPDTLALYHCDEGEGETLRDSSGKNHHGKIVGAKWVKASSGIDPDRAAVAGVLAIGRAVDVFAGGKQLQNIASAANLPPGPIEVRQVNVNRCPEATDENLACLRGCRHLQVVQFTNCPATDKSLAYLSESKGLRTLILYASGVTDSGLPLLEGFKELESLNVRQLPVTEPALKKLSAALPRCRIEWNQGTFGPASPEKR